jgi:hypothetical protein
MRILDLILGKFFGPWYRLGFNKCEMCGKTKFFQVEVGFYWTCYKNECIEMAKIQLEQDIEKFLSQE